MMGKHHVETAFGISAASVMTCAAMADSRYAIVGKAGKGILQLFIPENVSLEFTHGIMYSTPFFAVGALAMLWLGSLLPDIDQPNSVVGKKIHLPFKHRTWTHSIWFAGLCFALCFLHPIFRWLFFGCMLHIIGDGVSAAGICFLYPFQKYKEYSSGAFVAPGHTIKLYHTNNKSETRFVTVVLAVSILMCFLCRSGWAILKIWMLR